MMVVFSRPADIEPLHVLVQKAERETSGISNGGVRGEDVGFKIWHSNFLGEHFFFHFDYGKLPPQHLRVFPDLFDKVDFCLRYDGIPDHLKPLLSKLMATNEHEPYIRAAIAKIPSHVLAKIPAYETELGGWGTFDYNYLEESAEQSGYPLAGYLNQVIPVFKNINGQNAIFAPLRANRPGGNAVKTGIQPQVFQSIHYGYPGNTQALRDILFFLMKSGQLQIDRKSLDSLSSNPETLANNGIGSLVNGGAIVLSLDSEENNAKYSSVLNHPLDTTAYLRDLSPLSLAGVKAVSLVNRFSSFGRVFDHKLQSYLLKAGIEIPDAKTRFNGNNILAEGMCIVTYSTGFETDYTSLTKEKIAAFYTSMQLAIKRIMQQPGYEHASYIVGENVGRGAAETLKEKHVQGYVSRWIDIRPRVERINSTYENLLYEKNSVQIIADPESYSQVVIQFKQDKPFLERTMEELLDFADARIYNFNRLNELGITSDRNVFMRGNDFTIRPVPEVEKTSGLGFFERGSGRRIVTSPNVNPVELAAKIIGDQA